jgi:hypothetical protein
MEHGVIHDVSRSAEPTLPRRARVDPIRRATEASFTACRVTCRVFRRLKPPLGALGDVP